MSNDDSRPPGRGGPTRPSARSHQQDAAGGEQPRPSLGVPDLSVLSEMVGAALDGASRMTKDRARELAERALTQAGLNNVDLGEAATGATTKINQLADEILSARKANREMLQHTVSAELDKSLSRLGLARSTEIDDLRDDVARLRAEVSELRIAAEQSAASPARTPSARTPSARKPSARTAAAVKQAAAEQTAARRATATKATATKATATKATTTKAAAKKATATKAAATKATTKKATAKRTNKPAADGGA